MLKREVESISIMRIYAQEFKIVTALHTQRQVIIVHLIAQLLINM